MDNTNGIHFNEASITIGNLSNPTSPSPQEHVSHSHTNAQPKQSNYNSKAKAHNIIKISPNTDPKASGGSIAHRLRSNPSTVVLCSRPESINQAVKSLAIARTFLEAENLTFTVSPVLRDYPEQERVTFIVTRSRLTSTQKRFSNTGASTDTDALAVNDIRVAHASKTPVVAGSIAKRIRTGDRTYVTAMGAASVANAVLAIIRARDYLSADDIDISFRASFVHFEVDAGTRSGIRFTILRRDL